MPRKIVLTGRVPTMEDVARELGLTDADVRRIVDGMDAIIDGRLAHARRVRRRARRPTAPAAGQTAGTPARRSRA